MQKANTSSTVRNKARARLKELIPNEDNENINLNDIWNKLLKN